jgi:pyruvate carboxylase
MAENISFNFGAIRDTITRLSAVELIREQKSVTLDKFLKEIKQSPILTKQQFVFKNIENTKPFTKERLAERFIAQNMQLFKNFSSKQLNQHCQIIRVLNLVKAMD